MVRLNHYCRPCCLAVGLFGVLLASSLLQAQAAGDTNEFLFLTLRLKHGALTLEKAQVVPGTLKPQQETTEENALRVKLETSQGEARWSLTIDDPSIQRLEYEDPQQPGALKSKQVQVDDIEFIVRAPLIPGVRELAIHRTDKAGTQATGASATNSLLARIELPKAVTR